MPFHDAEQFMRLLRDHLAANDKRLTFLFGAGTSSAVNIAAPPEAGKESEHVALIPAVAQMTILCKMAVSTLSDEHSGAWTLLETECRELGVSPHIETILGRVRLKLDAAGPRDTVLGLNIEQLKQFEEKIRLTIAELASPPDDTIPDTVPHDQFAQWVRQARRNHATEIFTTNYDILIERSMERMRVPFFDGFVGSYRPFFSPDAVERDAPNPRSSWSRVWKLHGSTNWKLIDRVAVRLSKTGEGDMIMPSQRKYDESRKMPYMALMDRFTQCLSVDSSLLVTCGYSWNDEHINATILTTLDKSPSNSAIALMFTNEDLARVAELAETRTNLLVTGPREAVLRGQRHAWGLPKQVDKAAASFLNATFRTDDVLEDQTVAVRGTMLLGDFNIFSRFLQSMSDG